MKKSLITLLKRRPEEIIDSRMDRLFRVLSFYKCDQIQPSDFQRLLDDVNPYVNAATGDTSKIFQASMGGGFNSTSTYDWKLCAITQIGLIISKRYNSLEESFADCSG